MRSNLFVVCILIVSLNLVACGGDDLPPDVNGITISNLGTAIITADSFSVTVNFYGDDNSNAVVTLSYCNQTDIPGCDPTIGTSLATMVRGANSYTVNVTGLTTPNDPGDVLNISAEATDVDGISGSPQISTATLLINNPATTTNVPGGRIVPGTTNGGSWKSVAMSPDGTKITALNGYYFYTSTDSGQTWTERANDAQLVQKRTWNTFAQSSDGRKLIAGGYNFNNYTLRSSGSIYTSSDSGATWIERTELGNISRVWTSVASSADGTRLVAADSNSTLSDTGGYIYTSTDSGATWNTSTGAGVLKWNSVVVSADGTRIAATDGSYIFTSEDFGETWEWKATNMGTMGWTAIAMSADGSYLLAKTYSSAYTSADFGSTWTICTEPGYSAAIIAIAISADGSNIAIVRYSGGSGYSIFTSSDSGQTWTQRASTSSQNKIYSVALSSDGTQIVAGMRPHISTSTDSGQTWVERRNAGTRAWGSISSSKDGSKLAAIVKSSFINGQRTSLGYMYTSADSGQTWTEHIDATPKYLTAIAYSADGNRLTATAFSLNGYYPGYGHILLSSDSGATWTEETGDLIPIFRKITSSADGTKLAAIVSSNTSCVSGSIYSSTDSGKTWIKRVTANGAGLNSPVSVASSADGKKLVVVEFGGACFGGPGNIYTSADSGQTWTPSLSAYWSSVASSSDGTVLIASSGSSSGNGVYISSDSGATWNAISLRLPSTDDSWLSVAVSPDGTKFAAIGENNKYTATYSKYIYTSSDSGETWNKRDIFGNRSWVDITSMGSTGKFAAIAQGESMIFIVD